MRLKADLEATLQTVGQRPDGRTPAQLTGRARFRMALGGEARSGVPAGLGAAQLMRARGGPAAVRVWQHDEMHLDTFYIIPVCCLVHTV